MFKQPISYFRLCHISEGDLVEDAIEEAIDADIMKCQWIDCFENRVQIRMNAIDEVFELVNKNLAKLEAAPNSDYHPQVQFNISANTTVNKMVLKYKETGSVCRDVRSGEDNFVFNNGNELLPIPVLSFFH